MAVEDANAVELERAFTRTGRFLAVSIQSLLIAIAAGSDEKRTQALASVAFGLQHLMRHGNLLGRVGVLREAVESARRMNVAMPSSEPESVIEAPPAPAPPRPPDFPGLPKPGKPPVFREALDDIVSRAPKTIRDPLRRTAQEVGWLYREDHVFAMAKSAEDAVTKRVQDLIAQGIEEGLSTPEVIDRVRTDVRWVGRQTHEWTRAYTETVVRTNLTSAQTAGRFQQAQKPIVRRIMPAIQFVAVQERWDPRKRTGTRPNHQACHGATAPVEHPMWDDISPPLGYNCRCRVRLISWDMARRMGIVNEDGSIEPRLPKSGGGPDVGFVHAGRPK